MGTRNLTVVKSDNKTRVVQYGQWDGYPTGQGKDIAKFLSSINLQEFKKKLRKLKKYTKKELKAIEGDKQWKDHYPELSRDQGAKILELISDGKVTKVIFYENWDAKMDAFLKHDIWIEYDYVIDFDKETVRMNRGEEYTFEQWTSEGFMEKLSNEEQ